MIVKIPLVLALVACIKDVSSASFSKVFFQNGHEYPYEHALYSAPSYSYSPHVAKLTAAPVSSVLPYSVPYPHSSAIYDYPGQVASVAPSAKFIQYQTPGVPLVVAPQSDLAGYEYSYVVYDDHKAQLESNDGSAAHGGYTILQPEGFNAYVKSYVPEHAQHGHAGHVAAPCHEVENEHLTAHAHHETHHAEPESHEESGEHGDHHAPAHGSHGHSSHLEDHGHDHPHENHESHGHGHEGREETEHPHEHGHEAHEEKEHSHETHHESHEGNEHPDHEHSDHGKSSSSSEEHESHKEHEHPHGEKHDHAEHSPAHGESHERAHGHEEHDGSPESLETSHENVEVIHERHHDHHTEHASHLEDMSSESIESEAHDLAASRHVEHSNVLVPYNDIIKCVQAAMHGVGELSQPHHPESPLTYIVLNKPC